ncbi:Alpha/Beta hydrolase protein [Hyaloraphidium curvatum]|nr:Alpha/Beta hydrolase protein [Hyaloraphidium curvatum]
MGRLDHLLDERSRRYVAAAKAIRAPPLEDIAARRAASSALFRAKGLPDLSAVDLSEIKVKGYADTDPDVGLLVLRPKGLPKEGNPAILFVHGGGKMITDARDWLGVAAEYAVAVGGAVVFSVDFRNAPEHPHPSAMHDCFAGLRHISENARSLGIDNTRIAIFGQSGGGGLTASTVLMAKRERLSPPLVAQFAIYPMIDDRNETQSSKDVVDFGVWDRATNVHAWKSYLGGKPADIYAAPARATVQDLEGLPWTYVDVSDLDLYRDESIVFAAKLLEAGVGVELHVFSGSIHAWDVGYLSASLSELGSHLHRTASFSKCRNSDRRQEASSGRAQAGAQDRSSEGKTVI